MIKIIDSFKGEYKFLSNFYPVTIKFNDITYPSVEHGYQASKAYDKRTKFKIANITTPGDAKKAGRKIKMRLDWDTMKRNVMTSLIRKKFKYDPLRQQLINTKEYYLIEGNYWGDTFWGVCNGTGKNHLGNILMKVRKQLIRNDNK